MKKLLLLALLVVGGVSTGSAGTHKIYIQVRAGWESGIRLYTFQRTEGHGNLGDDTQSWPGKELSTTEKVGNTDFYVYEYTADDDKNISLIVSGLNGENRTQTTDIDNFTTGRDWYYTVTSSKSNGSQFDWICNDIYLLSNLDSNSNNNWKSWNTAFTDHKFSYVTWDGTQDIYEFVITPEILSTLTESDISFRINHFDGMGQRHPGSDYTYNLSSTISDTKQSTQGSSSAFIIQHSSINGSSYKITLYVKSASEEYVKADILSIPSSVTSVSYATFVCPYPLDFTSTAIKAYTASVNASTGVVTLTNINKVSATTPIILYKEGGETENIPVAAETDTPGANDLVAGTGATVPTDNSDGKYNYILNNVSGIGFYKANGQTVASNRAYLQTTYNVAATAGSRMSMVFADETTGITEYSMKTLNNNYFDMQGRCVAKPKNGLYIINGKKVIIK